MHETSINSILLSKLSGQIVRKNCPSVNKNFFQVTDVEKGHQGKVFEAEAEGQGLEMFPRCPFSTKVTWKKFLFTRGLFFPNKFVRTIMTTDRFFAHLPTSLEFEFQRNVICHIFLSVVFLAGTTTKNRYSREDLEALF